MYTQTKLISLVRISAFVLTYYLICKCVILLGKVALLNKLKMGFVLGNRLEHAAERVIPGSIRNLTLQN